MIEAKKKEGESAGALFFRFSRKVKRSGVLKEAKSRRFHDRPVTRLKRRISALHRESKKQEIERLKRAGMI
ncbi:MAG: 30S ribosomal protein S21 [Candidatus Liptonbacteria bacterium]|nr:30S ribosomal protein S21 [Candidatus Liptonbacteria bacterium]